MPGSRKKKAAADAEPAGPSPRRQVRQHRLCWGRSGGRPTRTAMLDLRLRDEFRGKRLKGTTVDFTNTSKTGALDVTASDFLKITYPSFDLLKTIEATGPG